MRNAIEADIYISPGGDEHWLIVNDSASLTAWERPVGTVRLVHLAGVNPNIAAEAWRGRGWPLRATNPRDTATALAAYLSNNHVNGQLLGPVLDGVWQHQSDYAVWPWRVRGAVRRVRATENNPHTTHEDIAAALEGLWHHIEMSQW